MALTGPYTLALAVVLALALPITTALLWNRLGHRPGRPAAALRWAGRGLLLVSSQLGAVILVAVLLNDANTFYSSWLQLLGDHHSLRTTVAAPGNQDDQVRQRLAESGAHGHGVVISLPIPGATSRIGSFTALVYLPAQYADPAYAHRTFPVVELIAGSPGTPKTWTQSLDVAQVLDTEIAAGRTQPVIAVMPSQDVDGARDTQCVNVVHGPQVDTYLSTDVHQVVLHSFRANPDPHAWSLMGYSSGGFCAVNLAMRHPDLFHSAVSISGYDQPAHDHQTGDLFAGDTALRNENTPLWRATHLPPPDVALLLMSSNEDPETAGDAAALATAARPPLSVTRVALTHGGHNFEVWKAEEPVAFAWLSTHLVPALAPPPVIDGRQPQTTS